VTSYETLEYEEEGPIAWVTLNRPEVHNAFNFTMMRELHACWRSLRDDDDVRVIVLTGAGDKAFCTGIDRAEQVGNKSHVNDVGQRGATPFHHNEPDDYLPPKTAADLWKPVIAAVNGMACAGAFYLLAEAEFIISAEHATYFDPHVTYGMATVMESIMMRQRMPMGEIMRMSLMGSAERLTASRAHEIGLVSEVVPADQLRAAARQAAEVIAAQSPLAIQATIRALWYAQEVGYRQALDVGKTLVMLGTDQSVLSENQKVFQAGARKPWRTRLKR
jgi:enoyl-CoA hydratase/carnithine racemase